MLYADVYVDEPIEKIADDWDFLNDRVISKFLGFRPEGHSIYGIRRLSRDTKESLAEKKSGPVNALQNRRAWEIGPKGVVEVHRQPLSVYVTRHGVPHRVEFVFGYWHVNDKDECTIDIPPTDTEPGYTIIVMGRPTGNECDRFAWYCEKCLSHLFMREVVTGTRGFEAFWPSERAAVREYNSDIKNRTCWQCGHVNPIGYCGFHMHDTPEEREARMSW